MHAQQPQAWIGYAITAAVIAFVFYRRVRRVGQHRPLRLEQLWIVPAIFVALTAATFYGAPPSPAVLGVCVLALGVGAGLGWQRGRMMHIHVDPETHALNQVQSWAALGFIVAVVAVRFGARALIENGVLPVHLDPRTLADVLMSFALGTFATMRLEMFLRARRLLAAARAGRA